MFMELCFDSTILGGHSATTKTMCQLCQFKAKKQHYLVLDPWTDHTKTQTPENTTPIQGKHLRYSQQIHDILLIRFTSCKVRFQVRKNFLNITQVKLIQIHIQSPPVDEPCEPVTLGNSFLYFSVMVGVYSPESYLYLLQGAADKVGQSRTAIYDLHITFMLKRY